MVLLPNTFPQKQTLGIDAQQIGRQIWGKVGHWMVPKNSPKLALTRRAGGATAGSVLKSIALGGLRPVLIGMVVGLGGVAGLSMQLHHPLAFPGSIDFHHGVSFYDPFTFFAITTFWLWFLSWRALDPHSRQSKSTQ